MEVIHPNLNKPVPVVGVLARELLPKSFDFDVTTSRKLCTFTPKGNDAIVNLTPGAAEAIGVVGATVNITYVTGASTVASIAALVAGSPAADALVSVSGDAGTFTTAASVTLDLWEDRPIPPALAYVLDANGNVVPMSGSSFSITAVVTPDRDNAYDCVKVDLNVNRAGGVEITKGGSSLAGRDLAVIKTDGDFIMRLNNNANDDIPQTTTDHGSFDNTDFSKIFLDHAPLGAGKFAYIYVGRKV